jgi:ADP-ribose pyrophosphatase YjhB (NUDIX family)
MLHKISELKKHILSLKNIPNQYNIAVGSLIFTSKDKVILIERGGQARDACGKMEGVGGSLDDSDTDLITALQREIQEELGDVKVEVLELLTIMTIPGTNNFFWIIPIYLCQLISGEPKIMEPEKCQAIHYVGLEEIEKNKLSDFQKETMKAYWKKYGKKAFYLK